jgi:hypothetical protein
MKHSGPVQAYKDIVLHLMHPKYVVVREVADINWAQ